MAQQVSGRLLAAAAAACLLLLYCGSAVGVFLSGVLCTLAGQVRAPLAQHSAHTHAAVAVRCAQSWH